MYRARLARLQLLISLCLGFGCSVAMMGGVLAALHANHLVALPRGGA
jgi:hypothetical protein